MLTDPRVDVVEAHDLPGFRAKAAAQVGPDQLNSDSSIALPTAVPLALMWYRGRLLPSLMADDMQRSANWRDDFLKTNLPSICEGRFSREDLLAFWRWLAFQNGLSEDGIRSRCRLKKNDFVSLIDEGIQRDLLFRLPAWCAAGSQSLLPDQLYWTDPGVLHQLIGLDEPLLQDWTGRQTGKQRADRDVLRGRSWEGFAVSTLLRAAGAKAAASYWRAEDEPEGEIDLILNWDNSKTTWAIEITLGRRKKTGPAFDRGCGETNAERAMIVYPEEFAPPALRGVSAVTLGVEKLTLNQALREVLEGPQKGSGQ